MASADDSLDFGQTIRGYASGQVVFNRYTLTKVLGRGGMGIVWLARDRDLDRDVALKFLPEIVALDKESLHELKREARRNLDLTHENIVRIYDFLQSSGTAAISMEFVDGVSLSALKLERPQSVFSINELRPLVTQLCTALGYAHRTVRIVHHDLKPANLMVNARGELKVTDFGIARSISDSVSRVSKQGSTGGTPLYMSPQQMMGDPPSVSDDVYSLGATLYELLTSKPPFYTGNVIAQVQGKVPPPLNERRQALGITGDPVPVEWEQTIAACLAKEAGARPASVEEVAVRVGLLAASKVDLTPKTVVEPPAAKGSGISPPTPSAVSSVQATEPAAPRSKAPLFIGGILALLAIGGGGYYFGTYAPEQRRLEAEARAEAQARLDAATKEQKRIEAEAEVRRAAEAKAARLAAARGGVTIRTTPAGAEVRIGSAEPGISPFTAQKLTLGKHTVRVTLADYEEFSGEVEVKEDETAQMTVPLVRSKGELAVASEPVGIPFEITGVETRSGTTPARFDLPVGAYAIEFNRPGWPMQRQEVKVQRQQTVSALSRFSAGRIMVTTRPAGAAITVAGKNVGISPVEAPNLVPGQVEIGAQLEGYRPGKTTHTIKSGALTTVELVLEALPRPQAKKSPIQTGGGYAAPNWMTLELAPLYDTHPKTLAENAKIQAEDAAAQKEVERLNGEGNEMLERVKALNSQADDSNLSYSVRNSARTSATDLLTKIQDKKTEVEKLIESTKTRLQERLKTFRSTMLAEISAEQAALAKRNGADLVLDLSGPSMIEISPILYADPRAKLAGGNSAAVVGARLVTVDIAKLYDNHPKTQSMNAKIQADDAKGQGEVDRMNAAGNALVAEYKVLNDQANAPGISADARARLQAEAQRKLEAIQAKQREVQNFIKNTRETLSQRLKTFRGVMLEEISAEVSATAKAAGASLVMDRAGPSTIGVSVVVYSAPSFDHETIKTTRSAPPVEKFATVDLAKLYDNHPKTIVQNAKIKADDEAAQADVDKMNKEGNALVAEYKVLYDRSNNSSFSSGARAQAQAEAATKLTAIQAKQKEVQDFIKKTRDSLGQRLNTFRSLILEEIVKECGVVAVRKGIDLLLDTAGPMAIGVSPIVFADPKFDLTGEIHF